MQVQGSAQNLNNPASTALLEKSASEADRSNLNINLQNNLKIEAEVGNSKASVNAINKSDSLKNSTDNSLAKDLALNQLDEHEKTLTVNLAEESPKEKTSYEKLMAAVNLVKLPLAFSGALSHIAAGTLSGAKLAGKDLNGAVEYEGAALKAADIYSKFISPVPLAIDAIGKLDKAETFWRGVAQLSYMSKMTAGHVSHLPFFTGILCAYNAYEKQLSEFFDENPHLNKHEAKSENRMEHLGVIFKNLGTIMKHSLSKLKSGDGDLLQNFSRVVVVPGFALPYFYGLAFGRGEKLHEFIHKLVRSSRSIIGVIEDVSMAMSKDKGVSAFGKAFTLDSLTNSTSPWLENVQAATDPRNLTGNLAAAIGETGNLLYSMFLAKKKSAEAAA